MQVKGGDKEHWQWLCAGGDGANMSSERLGVSPGERGDREGHRGWQGPHGRMSLFNEQWVPLKGFRIEDGQMTCTL